MVAPRPPSVHSSHGMAEPGRQSMQIWRAECAVVPTPIEHVEHANKASVPREYANKAPMPPEYANKAPTPPEYADKAPTPREYATKAPTPREYANKAPRDRQTDIYMTFDKKQCTFNYIL